MTNYEKNLAVLAKYYPQMDELIKKAQKKLESKLEIFEETADDGTIILKVKRGEKICYLNGKRNTKEPAQIWVQTLGELQTNAPVFMMGTGNPTYLEELITQTKTKITIIIYEPSLEIFLKFLEIVDLEQWMEKQMIIFWVDGLEDMDKPHMKDFLSGIIKYQVLEYTKNLILPNYDVLFAEEAVEFLKIYRDIVYTEISQYNTKNIFSSVMVKNLLSNAIYLCDGYKTTQLVDVIPRDIPGILVAAGPSLNKNIKELKRAKGRAFIIAVDTAIKPLLKEGIVPDMFAIIDAMKPLDLIEIEEAKEIPLLTTLNAASEILKYHKGMKFFYNEGYQFAERIFLKTGQQIGTVSCGGSVATSAFSLLYKIGINTIILVGQDLALTGNKTHADGTFKEKMDEIDTSNCLMVEGNFEEKVPTRVDFKIFIDWYNSYIEGCQDYRKGFRVINATEGGAKIEHTEVMTLKEAIDQECIKEVNIHECLDKLKPMLDSKGREWTVNYLLGLSKEFEQLSKEAVGIKRLYQKLDKACNKKKIDKNEYLNILKKLKKQIDTIEGKSTYQLVSITLENAKYILNNEQFLTEDSINKEGKEIARKGILYMDNVRKCALLFQEYAGEIFAELDSENVLREN